MTPSTTPEATAADPTLHLAATYRREVGASVARIFENVFDWEHLPALHDTYFTAIEKLDSGDWGWRVRLSRPPSTPGLSTSASATAPLPSETSSG